MTADTKRKRGRPPKIISASGETYSSLRISRERVHRAVMLASIPEDVFERELARKDVRPSLTRLVNIARGRPDNYRAGHPYTEALRAALRLSSAERIALAVAMLNADEAATVAARCTS